MNKCKEGTHKPEKEEVTEVGEKERESYGVM
jgi:hypothetical protein